MKIFNVIPLIGFLLSACGGDAPTDSTPKNEEEQVQNKTEVNVADCILETSDEQLEIVTWNVENFPKREQSTVKELAGIITAMDVDVIAMQEIKNKDMLKVLDEMLPQYEAVIMGTDNLSFAYLYKEDAITIKGNPYGILKKDKYQFAGRNPFVLPIYSKETGLEVILINTHLKAYGDEKSRKRRATACKLLKNWIDEEHPNDSVIVVGDMNDELTDANSENIFQNFLDDVANFRFADATLAEKENKKYWSYPSYPSHIDHILITNELFRSVKKCYTYVFQQCDKDYKTIISDHQPVCVVLE